METDSKIIMMGKPFSQKITWQHEETGRMVELEKDKHPGGGYSKVDVDIRSTNDSLKELLPCPFCGEIPELPTGDGTQYEIYCSCGMAESAIQISDLMTIDERVSTSFTNFRYGEKYIERAKVEAIKHWNNRPDNGLHHIEEALARVRKIHKPKFKHLCCEWDGLEIDEFCPEFNSCCCFDVSKS